MVLAVRQRGQTKCICVRHSAAQYAQGYAGPAPSCRAPPDSSPATQRVCCVRQRCEAADRPIAGLGTCPTNPDAEEQADEAQRIHEKMLIIKSSV